MGERFKFGTVMRINTIKGYQYPVMYVGYRSDESGNLKYCFRAHGGHIEELSDDELEDVGYERILEP